MKTYENIIQSLLAKNNGILSLKEANKEGIHRDTLEKLVRDGELEKAMPGFYNDPNASPDNYFILSKKFSKGIFSHETALYLYEYTDVTPYYFDLTFPIGYNNKNLKKYEVRGHYSQKSNYHVGKSQVQTIYGNDVPVYDRERTLLDIWSSRYIIDEYVKLEATKRYAEDSNKDTGRLREYIEILNYGQDLRVALTLLFHH